MKTNPDYEKDLATIRTIMERSSKFLSLSGLAGILAGIYALVGAAVAYRWIHYPASLFEYRTYSISDPGTRLALTVLALIVLAASLLTALWLSGRKAKKRGERLWNGVSRKIFINFAVPLVTGGLFVLIVFYTGHFGLAAPGCLIFYGLALINISANTFDEVRYLGMCEIVLGLIGAALPGFGLALWAMGFGVLHIVYGVVMYNRYDK